MQTFPANISLSTSYSNGDYGQMICYYDCGSKRFETKKAKEDHHLQMRQADAILLRALVENFYEAIIPLLARYKFPNSNSLIASISLKICWRALGQEKINDGEFNMLEPYSPQLLSLASKIIAHCLIPLDCKTLAAPTPELLRLNSQLAKIATTCMNTYELIEYHEA